MPILAPIVSSDHVKMALHLDRFTIVISLQKFSQWQVIFLNKYNSPQLCGRILRKLNFFLFRFKGLHLILLVLGFD